MIKPFILCVISIFSLQGFAQVSTQQESVKLQDKAKNTADSKETVMKKPAVENSDAVMKKQADPVENSDAVMKKQADPVENRDAVMKKQADPVENRDAVMKKQAIADYKEGSKAFYDRDFDQALLLFTKAYRVIKNPIMIYNIARCFEEKKDFASAIKFYREYLDTSESADDKIEVVLTINVLEGLLKPAPTLGTNTNQLWGWTSVGLGGIFLLGGVITGFDVLDKTDQLNQFSAMDSIDRYQSIQASRNDSALLTDGLMIGSLVFSTIGAYLLINQFSDPKANYQPKHTGMKPISIQQSPFSFSF